MSNIYETVTGDPAANFYGFAIIILTVGNIFAIIGSATLNVIGKKFPAMTGDKKTLVRGGENIARDDAKVKSTVSDMLGAILLAFALLQRGPHHEQKNTPYDRRRFHPCLCLYDHLCGDPGCYRHHPRQRACRWQNASSPL